MHDFFVDRLVHTRSISRLFALSSSKARQGGGSLHDIRQEEVKGGNAVNLAHALAVLGAKVLLITHSDAEHIAFLRRAFKGLQAEIRIKPLPPGLTVALEERVNVMVSDSGGAANFAPSLLAQSDWDALLRSRVVCSVNWAANDRGTQLLRALRRELGGEAVLFLSPSDVRDRAEAYAALVSTMTKRRLVDWLSVNECEATSTARALGLRERAPSRLCRELAEALQIRVDVHTATASYTSSGGPAVERKTEHVKPKRRTGAGDVWDAASILGHLKGMGDVERLDFANAAAKLYVKARRAWPPTFREVSAALG
jgi:sugar/nucleoside kinase (ribokinase family)